MWRKYPKLFQDQKIDYPIYDLDLNFDDYIKKSREIITEIRQDLDNNANLIVDANSPFEFRPAQKAKYGALLIHGLLDSPFIMRDIGNQLCQKGLLVRSLMLPGHSTVPGSLLNTDYTEWVQAVRYGIATFKNTVEKIFLVGFSTGASLSLYHAAEDHSLAGLIMIAPAIRINSPFAFAAHLPTKIRWASKRAQWLHISEENDYAKYRSIPFNAVHQVHRLAKLVKKISPEKLSYCPLFVALSWEDKIVASYSSVDYFKQSKNPHNHMLIYSGKPLHIDDKRIHIRNSIYANMNILNFSHVTLPVAPDNIHYGIKGDYSLASHLDKNMRYGAFDKIDLVLRNLFYSWKMSRFQYQRLTFNPDFDFFMQEIEKFIFKI